MMTFQDLIDELGSETVYQGTQVDQATQGALLEWNFDRRLSVCDETKWLRYYRRNLNMYYPIYMDYLRVESVRSNMDPFISEFMERIHDDNGTSVTSGTKASRSNEANTGGTTTVTDNTNVRTPDLQTDQAGTHSDTTTSNGSQSTQGNSTSTKNSSESGSENAKQRTIGIGYPEANLGSISPEVDGFPTSIAYATSDALIASQGSHSGQAQGSETNTNAQSGSNSNTDANNGMNTNTVRETGTDRNKFDGRVINTDTRSKDINGSETNSGTTTNQRKLEETEQGRHESPADILPRAISAITGTNSIKWLVDKMMICFDNYAEI